MCNNCSAISQRSMDKIPCKGLSSQLAWCPWIQMEKRMWQVTLNPNVSKGCPCTQRNNWQLIQDWDLQGSLQEQSLLCGRLKLGANSKVTSVRAVGREQDKPWHHPSSLASSCWAVLSLLCWRFHKEFSSIRSSGFCRVWWISLKILEWQFGG